MATQEIDNYILPRNKIESDRLDDQHRYLVENAGYVIHPSILRRLPDDARIADVGTGTGAYALNAAMVLPDTTRVFGFDISSDQFPASYPSNVSFETADATKPFPDAYHSSFDLITLRALVPVLAPPQWDVVMRNVIQLLKPGGCIQWSEADNSCMRCLRNSPGSEYRQFTAFPKLLQEWRLRMGNHMSEGVQRLSQAASTHLENLETEVVSTDRVVDLRAPWARQTAAGMSAWAQKAEVWPLAELEKLKQEIEIEIQNGAYVRQDMLYFIGQKPKLAPTQAL